MEWIEDEKKKGGGGTREALAPEFLKKLLSLHHMTPPRRPTPVEHRNPTQEPEREPAL
jgi:hypothetical protein